MTVKSLASKSPTATYHLDDQVGFILRQVNQRHTSIFASRIGCDLTAMQWAVLSKLHEIGPTSQNQLGRATAMDVATIKGVVDRLTKRALTYIGPDPADARRRLIALTHKGAALVGSHTAVAREITDETLGPLSAKERKVFMELLVKLR